MKINLALILLNLAASIGFAATPLTDVYLQGTDNQVQGTLTTQSGSSLIINPGTNLSIPSNAFLWSWINKGSASLADLPTRNFSDLQNKPNTLAGYGIIDPVVTTTESQTISGNKTFSGSVVLSSVQPTFYSDNKQPSAYVSNVWYIQNRGSSSPAGDGSALNPLNAYDEASFEAIFSTYTASGTFVLGAGVFSTNHGIVLHANQTLVGMGWGVTVIKATGLVSNGLTAIRSQSGSNAKNMEVSNLTIDCNAQVLATGTTSLQAISLYGSNNRIRKIQIINGICQGGENFPVSIFAGSAEPSPSVGNIIEGCEFKDWQGGQPNVFTINGDNNTVSGVIRNNRIEGNAVIHAIGWGGFCRIDSMLVEGNLIEGRGEIFSDVSNSTNNLIIKNNTMINPTGDGPSINIYSSSTNVSITGNYLHGTNTLSGGGHIGVTNATKVDISNNKILSDFTTGYGQRISVSSSVSSLIIANNIISPTNDFYPMYIYGANNARIFGNTYDTGISFAQTYFPDTGTIGAQNPIQTVTPTTGTTVSFTLNGDSTLNLTPASTLSALTVTLPSNSNSFIGQICRIFSSKELTTLTVSVSGGGTINGTTLTSLASNCSASYQKTGINVWTRMADVASDPNVALLNGNQTFTGSNSFSGPVTLSGGVTGTTAKFTNTSAQSVAFGNYSAGNYNDSVEVVSIKGTLGVGNDRRVQLGVFDGTSMHIQSVRAPLVLSGTGYATTYSQGITISDTQIGFQAPTGGGSYLQYNGWFVSAASSGGYGVIRDGYSVRIYAPYTLGSDVYLGMPNVNGTLSVFSGVVTASPASGATVSFSGNIGNQTMYLTPGATIATLTVSLPSEANSIVGQVARIFSTQTITALTVTNATTIQGVPGTLNGNTGITLTKVAANTWACFQ